MSSHSLEFPNYDSHTPGLHEIDPLPVIEEPSSEKLFSSSTPDEASSPHRNGTALGLTAHSPAWYLTRIQRYSSYAFTAFAAMHITNTALIPLATRSVPASEPYVLLTRPYYQSPLAEPLVVAIPLWAHVVSGVALRVYRRNQHAKHYGEPHSRQNRRAFFTARFWPRVSGITRLGFILTPLVAGHVLVNRALPRALGKGNVGLDYVAHAFARHPIVSSVGFAALVIVGGWHVTWGWAKWLGWTPDQTADMGPRRELVKKRRWYIINAVAAAVTGLWMAGSFGVVAKGGQAPGWVGREYDDMYRAIPVVGRWL